MGKDMREYKIKIKDEEGNVQILEILSTNIEWSMKQYQRNRDQFSLEIYEDEAIDESQDERG